MKKRNFLIISAICSFAICMIALATFIYLEEKVKVNMIDAKSWIATAVALASGYGVIVLTILAIGAEEKPTKKERNSYKGKNSFEVKEANACVEVSKEEPEKNFFKQVKIAKAFVQHLEEIGLVPTLYVRYTHYNPFTGETTSEIIKY